MFEGYLIKIGEYEFPMEYLAEETYNVSPHQRQELEAERDNLGELYRVVAENRPTSVEFSTISGLTNKEVRAIFERIHYNYVTEEERKVPVTYYDPETDEYCGPEMMYIPNPKFPIDHVNIKEKTVTYNSISLQLVGY